MIDLNLMRRFVIPFPRPMSKIMAFFLHASDTANYIFEWLSYLFRLDVNYHLLKERKSFFEWQCFKMIWQ